MFRRNPQDALRQASPSGFQTPLKKVNSKSGGLTVKSAANKSSFSRLHKWGITKCPGGRERNLRRSSLRGKVRTRTPSWLKIIRLPSNVVVGGEICVIRGYISLRNQRNLRLKNSCQFVSIFFVPLCLSGISTTVEDSLQIHPFYAKQTQFTKYSNEHNFC